MIKIGKKKDIHSEESSKFRVSNDKGTVLVEEGYIEYKELSREISPQKAGNYSYTEEMESSVCPFYGFCLSVENLSEQVFCLSKDRVVCRKRVVILCEDA